MPIVEFSAANSCCNCDGGIARDSGISGSRSLCIVSNDIKLGIDGLDVTFRRCDERSAMTFGG